MRDAGSKRGADARRTVVSAKMLAVDEHVWHRPLPTETQERLLEVIAIVHLVELDGVVRHLRERA